MNEPIRRYAEDFSQITREDWQRMGPDFEKAQAAILKKIEKGEYSEEFGQNLKKTLMDKFNAHAGEEVSASAEGMEREARVNLATVEGVLGELWAKKVPNAVYFEKLLKENEIEAGEFFQGLGMYARNEGWPKDYVAKVTQFFSAWGYGPETYWINAFVSGEPGVPKGMPGRPKGKKPAGPGEVPETTDEAPAPAKKPAERAPARPAAPAAEPAPAATPAARPAMSGDLAAKVQQALSTPKDTPKHRWRFVMRNKLTGEQTQAEQDVTARGIRYNLNWLENHNVFELVDLQDLGETKTAAFVALLKLAQSDDAIEKFKGGTPIIFIKDVELAFDALDAHGVIKENMTGKIKKVLDEDYVVDIAGQIYKVPKSVANHVMDIFVGQVAGGADDDEGEDIFVGDPHAQEYSTGKLPAEPEAGAAAPAEIPPNAVQPQASILGFIVVADDESMQDTVKRLTKERFEAEPVPEELARPHREVNVRRRMIKEPPPKRKPQVTVKNTLDELIKQHHDRTRQEAEAGRVEEKVALLDDVIILAADDDEDQPDDVQIEEPTDNGEPKCKIKQYQRVERVDGQMGTVVSVNDSKPDDYDILILWDEKHEGVSLYEDDIGNLTALNEEPTAEQLAAAQAAFEKWDAAMKSYDQKFEDKIKSVVETGHLPAEASGKNGPGMLYYRAEGSGTMSAPLAPEHLEQPRPESSRQEFPHPGVDDKLFPSQTASRQAQVLREASGDIVVDDIIVGDIPAQPKKSASVVGRAMPIRVAATNAHGYGEDLSAPEREHDKQHEKGEESPVNQRLRGTIFPKAKGYHFFRRLQARILSRGSKATFEDLAEEIQDREKDTLKLKEDHEKDVAKGLKKQQSAAPLKSEAFTALLDLIERDAPGIPAGIGRHLFKGRVAREGQIAPRGGMYHG